MENFEKSQFGGGGTELCINLKPKTRDANFELLRILSMLMIICLHLGGYSEFLTETTGINFVVIKILHAASSVSVNIFVMISCYFLVSKKVSYKKLLKLWFEVLFYSAIIYIIFLACGWKTFELKDLVYFVPVTGVYWFFTAYLLLYLAIPFLNAMLSNVSQKQHLCLFFGLMLIAMINFLPLGMKVFDFNLGFSAIWFMTIFIFMFYMKKYGIKELNVWIYVAIFVATTAISYFAGASYCSPFVFLASYCLFMIFKKVKIKNARLSKFICFISSTTFAVYLIHGHPLINEVLWTDILHIGLYANSPYAILIFIGLDLAIFAACSIVDVFRILLFKLIKVVINKIKNKKDKTVNEG